MPNKLRPAARHTCFTMQISDLGRLSPRPFPHTPLVSTDRFGTMGRYNRADEKELFLMSSGSLMATKRDLTIEDAA